MDPYQPPAWLRVLMLGLGAGVTFAAIVAAAGGSQRELGRAPLVLLGAALIGYLVWLSHRERQLGEELGEALALGHQGQVEAARSALQRLVARARVHHPHLASQAVVQLAELALQGGDPAEAVCLLRAQAQRNPQGQHLLSYHGACLLAEAYALLDDRAEAALWLAAALRRRPLSHLRDELVPGVLLLLRAGDAGPAAALLAAELPASQGVLAGTTLRRLRVLHAFAAHLLGEGGGRASGAALRQLEQAGPGHDLRFIAPWPELGAFLQITGGRTGCS